ncbi:pyrimidine reductase family protein [Prauserella oleivorans]
MHRLWPTPADAAGPLSDAELEELYDFPAELDRPWIQANFVSSADGAVTVDDRSEGLSSPADKRVFLLGRDLADVILVGAGTVLAETYKGAKPGPERMERRRRHGLADTPPIAIVTGRCTIRPYDPVVTDTRVPPIILTTEAAPAERRKALADAGAEVVVLGEHTVDLPAAVAMLGERGLRRIDCEGGPHLFGTLIAEDLVDELCLTVAPLLAGAAPGRIAAALRPRRRGGCG